MAQEQIDFDLDGGRGRVDDAFAPDRVRAEAVALLAEARRVVLAGEWDADKLRFKRMLFPYVVSWLPDSAERDQLCFAFVNECDRIELLLAA